MTTKASTTNTSPKHVPFGYQRSDKTGKLKLHRGEQRVIKKIVKLRDDGYTIPLIFVHLNMEGIPSKQGKQWGFASVERVLLRYDEAHLGEEELERLVKASSRHQPVKGFVGQEPQEPPEGVSIFPRYEDFECSDGISVIRIPAGSAKELRESGRIEFEGDPYIDQASGKWTMGRQFSYSEQDLMDREAQSRAEARLSVLEREERVRFEDPGIRFSSTWGRCLDPVHITPAAAEQAAKATERLHALLDRLKGDPQVKRELREEVKAVFRALAAERQFTLHVLWRLEAAEKQAG